MMMVCVRYRWVGRSGILAALLGTALAAACARSQPASVTLIGVPGHRNEHVSAASDGASLVALTWAASTDTGADIFASVSDDGGESFSTPVRVNTRERQANVNGEQPPRIAIEHSPDGGTSIVVLWTAKGSGGTSLLSGRSTDGGRTFGPTSPMPSVDAPGNRGWQSMAASATGGVYALWLDHRDTVQAMAGHAHQHGADASVRVDGVARAQRSQLFVGSLDGGLPPKSIARGVCYCCKTALTTDLDGTIYAAWRHVYPGNERDIAFTMSRDGGRSFDEPSRVSEDEWQLDGCPENGPALAVDASRRIHVLWPTLVRNGDAETLKLFHAFSVDGRVFTPRVELPTAGAAYHPQLVVAPDGSLVAAWDELEAGERRVRAARGEAGAGGRYVFSGLRVAGDAPGAYPALATTANHTVVAWAQRSGDATTIAVSRLSVP
jgi:hypothetical protein